MVDSVARIKRGGKHFEILVDLDETLKFLKGNGDIFSCVLTEDVFYNLKSGEHASKEDLKEFFLTTDFYTVAEKIIKSGEVVRPSNMIKEEQNQKYKQVVDFLSKNATNPEGKPYSPDKIMNALKESHINIKNKSIESQITEVIDELCKILPIKIEKKKVRLRIPVSYTGKVYGNLKNFIIDEKWENNGDLTCIVEVPSGMIIDFYDSINDSTHGSVLSEDIK